MHARSPIEPETADSVRIRVKAVPGAKRDQIAGPLGDRLKVRVSAPPEGGRANAAICALLAASLGVRARDVEVVAGPASAEKTVRAAGIDAATARARLGCPAQPE
ncbi:MAG TPA: DUF167 domain-containing protein [Phycisphaerales bacterium]|nr:DUF167 domain-containing protein [Phycisphaerales bacterium]